jgi:hypothetical protein
MVKRLIYLIGALAVLGSAVPAMADATKATLPAGIIAPVGTPITLTGSDFALQSNLIGVITCARLDLKGEITKNDGTTVKASGQNTNPTQAGCVNGTKSWPITSFEISELASSSTGSVTWSFKYTQDWSSGPCTFVGTKVPGTFTSGTNVIKFSSAGPITSSPSACGTGKITGEFAIEQTGTTTPLILD